MSFTELQQTILDTTNAYISEYNADADSEIMALEADYEKDIITLEERIVQQKERLEKQNKSFIEEKIAAFNRREGLLVKQFIAKNVLDKVLNKLITMPDNEYETVMKTLLTTAVYTDNTIVKVPFERENVMLKVLPKTVKLTPVKNISSGCIIKNGVEEIDYTFETLINTMFKESILTKINTFLS